MSENKNNEVKSSSRKKTNGYNSSHLQAKRNRKRLEAEARQQEHASLTLQEKLEKARSRGGSNKEINRLMKMIEAAGISVKPPTPEPVAESKPKATRKTAKRSMKKVAKKKSAK